MPYRKKSSILLINPNWTGSHRQLQVQLKRLWQPLDLAIAAGLLEREGFSVRILDNNIERIHPLALGELATGYDKIFVTSTPYDRWQCPSLDIRFFFETVSGLPSDRLYIMGAHVTQRPLAILKESRARAAILHEPEQTILDICLRDDSGGALSEIPGIAFLEGEQLIRSNARGYMEDMDSLPYPAFHLLSMDRYRYELMGDRFAILESSRGCPIRCSFCYLGMYGARFRQKSLERFLEELDFVRKQLRVENFYFMDLEFGLNRDFLMKFCMELIQRKISIRWCCQTRVTDLDEEILAWMKKSGCTLVHFGVEAGSERILQETGKKITVPDCIRAVSLARAAGIRTALFMNFGFPEESLEEMEQTISLAIRLDPTYVAFHLIVPFPGTRLAESLGVDPEMFPPHEYPHYNFVHHDLGKLKSMLRKAYFKFYFRSSRIRVLMEEGLQNGFRQAVVFLKMVLG